MRRTVLLAMAGAAAAAAVALFAVRRARHPTPPGGAPLAAPADSAPPSLAHLAPASDEAVPEAEGSPVPGLDLLHVATDSDTATAPAHGGTAHLTLDSDLQRTARALMAAHHVPEAAVVLMDVATGRLLVYASHVDDGPLRDLCAEATAPSASVFKIVTSAALIEDAHLGPDTRKCYWGGEQRITLADLVDDPARDRWCATLAGALGRSINTVFARLAEQRLTPRQLEAMARRFGYGEPLAFDVPVQPNALRIPSEPLEFARTAAGFWNTTLSPLEAAEMSAIVARGGEAVRPRVVDEVVSPAGAAVWTAPAAPATRRVVEHDTADDLTRMMEHTISEGTSFRAFHDGRGRPYLPGIGVAGKTGTLTDYSSQRYYTWFTGFAPARPEAGVPRVAVAALVVNGPVWQVKANVLARDVLRAFFASRGIRGVSRPAFTSVARHHRRR